MKTYALFECPYCEHVNEKEWFPGVSAKVQLQFCKICEQEHNFHLISLYDWINKEPKAPTKT